uniref:Uncharacterized protein n=1 Tax=Pararge aegeria TaxID=116150 RepID=S4P2U1_9NEOP
MSFCVNHLLEGRHILNYWTKYFISKILTCEECLNCTGRSNHSMIFIYIKDRYYLKVSASAAYSYWNRSSLLGS